MVLTKQRIQQVNNALRSLALVEQRSWVDILLSSDSPIFEAAVAGKLVLVAAYFDQFLSEHPRLTNKAKQEAYAVLAAAITSQLFPGHTYHLTKSQFQNLLDMHLNILSRPQSK